MQSTVQSSSNRPESVSRKRAREEVEEEDLSVDIPPQKKNKLEETASLESDLADSDQPHLILPPPPEPRPRYQTPSPESIPAILPPVSPPSARYKRKRAESETEDAAPSKRRNVAQEATQTPMRVTRSAARRAKSVGDDKPSDGDLTSAGPSSASPSTGCDDVKRPTSSKPEDEEESKSNNLDEVEEEDAADSDGYTRFRARLSSLLAPKRRNLRGEWAAIVGKPSPLHRKVLETCAVCVQQETRQWYPRGFPHTRIPMVNSSDRQKYHAPPPQPSPSASAPPPCAAPSPVAGEMFQAGTHYASASSFIQLDPELEVPASWRQEQQWVHGGVHDGGHWNYNMAVLPSANLHDTYWYNGPPQQQSEEVALDGSSVERYADEPQQSAEFALDVEHNEPQYTPPDFVPDVFSADHQFHSLNSEMNSPFIFEPIQVMLLNLPSSPSIPLHSLSKDSTLSPMHGYIAGMQAQAAPVAYLDQDVVESSSVETC